MSEATESAAGQERGTRKERVGLVTSTAMNKTITVSVAGVKAHQLYKKRMKTDKKYKAHDEQETCQVGDLVRIRECRPLSKTKRWRLAEIIKRAE
jgi:small subunit ribosomal protein S17